MRVVVIGAGVVGAAVAAGLTRRGADVTVLEARRPGAGTTTTSFAWINAGNKNPDSYYALNHAGVHAHHEFAGDGAPWFFPTGNLEWAVSEDDRSALARRIDKAHERDYPVQRLTAEQAATLEPDLIGQPAGTEYVLSPTEAHTYPALLLARLLGEAKDRGATVISRAQVTVGRGPGGTMSVETADGARYTADIVISCAGRWTEQVAELAGAYAPMLDPDLAGSATVGFLATTALVPTRLSRVLTAPDLNVRPDGAGRLLLQTLDLDRLADPTAPPALDSAIAKEMVGRLPARPADDRRRRHRKDAGRSAGAAGRRADHRRLRRHRSALLRGGHPQRHHPRPAAGRPGGGRGTRGRGGAARRLPAYAVRRRNGAQSTVCCASARGAVDHVHRSTRPRHRRERRRALARRGASLTVVDAAHGADQHPSAQRAAPPLTSGSTRSLRRDHLGGLIRSEIVIGTRLQATEGRRHLAVRRGRPGGDRNTRANLADIVTIHKTRCAAVERTATSAPRRLCGVGGRDAVPCAVQMTGGHRDPIRIGGPLLRSLLVRKRLITDHEAFKGAEKVGYRGRAGRRPAGRCDAHTSLIRDPPVNML